MSDINRKEELARFMVEYERFMRSGTSRDIHIAQNHAAIIAKRILAEKEGDREQYLTWQIADQAYKNILNHDVSARVALEEAAGKFSDEIDKVLAEKSRKSKGLNKSIIKNNAHHPIQKEMKKKGQFDSVGIKQTSNVWQMLRMLKHFKTAYENILELERALVRIDVLETKVDLAQKEIEELQHVVGVEGVSDKDKIAALKAKGFTQKSVADILKISLRTVKRKWN